MLYGGAWRQQRSIKDFQTRHGDIVIPGSEGTRRYGHRFPVEIQALVAPYLNTIALFGHHDWPKVPLLLPKVAGVVHIGLVQRLIIHIHLPVTYVHPISWQANDPFDEIAVLFPW